MAQPDASFLDQRPYRFRRGRHPATVSMRPVCAEEVVVYILPSSPVRVFPDTGEMRSGIGEDPRLRVTKLQESETHEARICQRFPTEWTLRFSKRDKCHRHTYGLDQIGPNIGCSWVPPKISHHPNSFETAGRLMPMVTTSSALKYQGQPRTPFS